MPAHSKMQSPAVTQHPDVRLCGCAEESIASYNYSSLNVSAILLSCVLGTIVSVVIGLQQATHLVMTVDRPCSTVGRCCKRISSCFVRRDRTFIMKVML